MQGFTTMRFIIGGHMGSPKPTIRAVVSLVLAFVVASVFTLSSFAASTKKGPTGGNVGGRIGKTLLDAPKGRLVGTGRVTIDGDEARSGATVLSGSTIATATDGNAGIDLGSLGRFELQPNTTITLMFTPNSVQVRMNGGGLTAHTLPGVTCRVTLLSTYTKVIVASGEVKVNSAGTDRNLVSGQESRFMQGSEATTMGESVFTAEGDSDRRVAAATHGGGRTVSGGAAGAITLAGLAGGVALGVALGSNNSGRSPLPKPSTVVP
jgi:hypothetical protein